MALDAEWRDHSAYRSAVRWIVHPTHESVRLQAIRQLRDIRTHTLEAAGQLTQCQWLASLNQGIERLELGGGESDRLQRRFKTILNGSSCLKQAHQQAVPRAFARNNGW